MQGFWLGPFFIYTWGLTAAIGIIAAVWLASRRVARQTKISENQFWNLAILLVITAFVGARVLCVLEDWNYFFNRSAGDFPLMGRRIFFFWRRGRSHLGRLLLEPEKQS